MKNITQDLIKAFRRIDKYGKSEMAVDTYIRYICIDRTSMKRLNRNLAFAELMSRLAPPKEHNQWYTAGLLNDIMEKSIPGIGKSPGIIKALLMKAKVSPGTIRAIENYRSMSDPRRWSPMIAAMKTSVFGEFVNEQSFENAPYLNFIAKILFWDNVLIAAAALVCMIAFLFVRSDADSAHNLFLVSFWLAMILSFYKMAHDYPFTCTMNFRYITPTVMIGCLFIGFALNELKDCGSKARYIKYIAEACVLLFSSASTLVYLALV